MKKEQELGKIKLHGRSFVGRVVSTKMQKTVTVEWDRVKYIHKYERNEKRRSRVHAHLPSSIQVKDGDIVKITETRPLSKTKTFVVVEKVSEGHLEAHQVRQSKKENKAEE
jgi:small subunit ribosomal protein S17